MTQNYDAIIIGAGISGAAVAYALSKKGYRTLNIEKLAAAGHGSTANTCAIIRTQYSTLDGTADKMRIKTRPLRHEVHFVPSPAEFSYAERGLMVSDGDAGGYHRPEAGNMILVGSEDPACDTLDWVEDADSFNREVTTEQWKAQVHRIAKRIPNLPIPGQPKGISDCN